MAPRVRAAIVGTGFMPRELLGLDAANTHLVVGRIDEAAACMYALQHEVLPAQGIPIQGTGREPYRS
jgi:hypothetical protein